MGRPPGLLAQAASTMGGAVAGSVIGHGISNMIFGSGRPVDQSRADVPPPAEYAQAARAESGGCDIPAKGEFYSMDKRKKEGHERRDRG